MSFSRELKDFTAGFQAGHQMSTERTRANTEWEKVRPITEGDISSQPAQPGGSGTVPHVGTDSTQTSSTGGGGKVDTDTNHVASQLKADLMKDFKISDVAAGGIVASLAAESGGFKIMQEIGSERYGKGARGGYGYAQWTGPRRREFEKFAKDNNLDINSYEANYGNLKRELQGPEGAVLKQLAGAKDYHEATDIFTGSAKEGRGFLRPGDVNLGGRFTWADRVAGVKPFSGTQETGEVGTGTASLAPTHAIDEPTKTSDDALASSQAAVPKPQQTSMAIPEQPTGQVALTDWEGFLKPGEEEEEEQPMFAARGGVIPEPTQSFADGGTPNTTLPYPQPGTSNPEIQKARQHGLAGGSWAHMPGTSSAAAVGGPSTFTPRRVGQYQTGTTPYQRMQFSNGMTPSQVAFKQNRDASAARAAQEAADKAAAAAAAAAAKNKPIASKGPYGGLSQADWMRQHGYGVLNPSTGWYSKRNMGVNAREQGGMVYHNFERGGVVPEPDDEEVSYARGGQVEDRDALFQRLLKEEKRHEHSGGGGAQDSARDRAAKRLSALEGRPISSAYRPGQGKGKGGVNPEYWKPKTDPGTTKSIDKPVGPGGTPTAPYEPSPGAIPAGTPTEGYEPKPKRQAAGTPTAPYEPSPGAIPAGTPTGPYEPPPPPLPQTETDNAWTRPLGAGETAPVQPWTGPQPQQGPPMPPPQVAPTVEAPAPDNAWTQPLGAGETAQVPDASAPPAAAPQVAPQPERPDYAPFLKGAMNALRKGQDPKRIGDLLINAGVPQDAWPLELQNAYLGFTNGGGPKFAEGGAVPDEQDMPQQGQRGYNEAVAEGRTATRTPMQSTPALISDTRKALHGGISFLTRHFGMDQQEAMPSPEGQANSQAGKQRFASGEGEATPDEIEGIDNHVDPGRELDEGQRQMTRLAQTMRWYQGRGRKEEAEAAAGSLMQYGASRFSKLGTLAQAAYQNGDINGTVKYLEKAYEMIPDGAQVNVRVNDQTGKLEATRTDDEGNEEFHEIDPSEIPQLLRSVQDKSSYWNSIFRIADPEGAKSKDIEERTIRTEGRTEKREIAKEGRTEERELAKEGRTGEAEIAKEGRTEEREKEKEIRTAQTQQNQKLLDEALLRSRPDKATGKQKDMAVLGPIMAEASAAKAAFEEDDSDENKHARDVAYSKLAIAADGDGAWMQTNGFEPGGYQFIDPGGAGTQTAAASDVPPEGAPPGTKRMKHPKTGLPIWAYQDPKTQQWAEVQ